MRDHKKTARQIITRVLKRTHPEGHIEPGEIADIANLVQEAVRLEFLKVSQYIVWWQDLCKGTISTAQTNRIAPLSHPSSVLDRVISEIQAYKDDKVIPFFFRKAYVVSDAGELKVNVWYLRDLGVSKVSGPLLGVLINNQTRVTWFFHGCVGAHCTYYHPDMAGKTIELEFEAT